MTKHATRTDTALSIIYLFAIIFLSACQSDQSKVENKAENKAENHETGQIKTVKVFPYDIKLDSAIYLFDTIRQNDYLANILLRETVSYETVERIAKAADTVYSVKKFRSGNPYCIIRSKDSIAKYFIYEINTIEFVVYNFAHSDSIIVYRGKKPVSLKIRTVSGTIENSLWLSMKKANASPLLAMYLSDIFAWTIDFYHIQKGDKFSAIYDETWVNNQKAGIHQVLAAKMSSGNKAVYAFWFEKDSINDYFDSTGHSMRKAFLKAPLKFSRISSRYSTSRYHPILHRNKAHLGTDFAAPYGTPILATGDGVISRKGFTSGNGRFIKIKHNSVYSTQYLHMSKFANHLKIGSRVKQGDVIGYVGSSGLATGPHVCYRFWKNGQQVDPFKEKLPPSKLLPESYQNDFEILRDSLLLQLNHISQQIPDTASISMTN